MSTYYPESFVRELTETVDRVAQELVETSEQRAARELLADQQRLAGKREGLERLQATLARVQAR